MIQLQSRIFQIYKSLIQNIQKNIISSVSKFVSRIQMKPQQKAKIQNKTLKQRKQVNREENEDFGLKMQKIQNQIASLNLEIEHLVEEKIFKENTQKTLVKERKKLENCFLFKDLQASRQIKNLDAQKQANTHDLPKHKVKNQFRDVNETIARYIENLQILKQKEDATFDVIQNQNQEQIQSQSSNRKLECQSLHLKQIFNPEQMFNHQSKVSKLQQKLSLLYQKIQSNLQREQPYLHEKILERIKRQAHSCTRKKLIQQIDKLIKQNSVWMTQETNRVNNQLEGQKVEQICVNNLELMKKIMAKKVANNDWIFENYSETNFIKESSLGFPAQKVSTQYQEVLEKIKQNRIAGQLDLVRKNNLSKKEQNKQQSLKELLSGQAIDTLMNQDGQSQEEFQQSERELMRKVEDLQRQVQKLAKL